MRLRLALALIILLAAMASKVQCRTEYSVGLALPVPRETIGSRSFQRCRACSRAFCTAAQGAPGDSVERRVRCGTATYYLHDHHMPRSGHTVRSKVG